MSRSGKRAGSAITLTSAIFPPLIKKASALKTLLPAAQTSPTAPLTSIGSTELFIWDNATECHCPLGLVPRPADFSRRAWTCPGFIEMNHEVRIEHRQQQLEFPAAQGRQKSTDNFPLFAQISFRDGACRPGTRRCARRLRISHDSFRLARC